ncbi:MAG: NUDIX-like domain-containing protein, partial [Hyphomonadaceae bacterium]
MASDIPFAATPPDRAAHHRTDAKWLDAAFAREDVLILLMQGGEPLLTGSGDALLWLGAQASALTDDAIRLFLGEDKNGVPIFALGLPEAFKLDASPIAGLGEFTDMRSAAVRLSALEVGLAATARSLFEWHRRHGFCANCGADTRITE